MPDKPTLDDLLNAFEAKQIKEKKEKLSDAVEELKNRTADPTEIYNSAVAIWDQAKSDDLAKNTLEFQKFLIGKMAVMTSAMASHASFEGILPATMSDKVFPVLCMRRVRGNAELSEGFIEKNLANFRKVAIANAETATILFRCMFRAANDLDGMKKVSLQDGSTHDVRKDLFMKDQILDACIRALPTVHSKHTPASANDFMRVLLNKTHTDYHLREKAVMSIVPYLPISSRSNMGEALALTESILSTVENDSVLLPKVLESAKTSPELAQLFNTASTHLKLSLNIKASPDNSKHKYRNLKKGF